MIHGEVKNLLLLQLQWKQKEPPSVHSNTETSDFISKHAFIKYDAVQTAFSLSAHHIKTKHLLTKSKNHYILHLLKQEEGRRINYCQQCLHSHYCYNNA